MNDGKDRESMPGYTQLGNKAGNRYHGDGHWAVMQYKTCKKESQNAKTRKSQFFSSFCNKDSVFQDKHANGYC